MRRKINIINIKLKKKITEEIENLFKDIDTSDHLKFREIFADNFREYVGVDPKLDQALLFAGICHEKFPGNLTVILSLARIHGDRNEFQSALKYIEQAYQQAPTKSTILKTYIQILAGLKDSKAVFDKAQELILVLLKTRTDDGYLVLALYNCAKICYRNKEKYQALRFLEQCNNIDPTHYKAYFLKAVILREFERYQEALAECGDILEEIAVDDDPFGLQARDLLDDLTIKCAETDSPLFISEEIHSAKTEVPSKNSLYANPTFPKLMQEQSDFPTPLDIPSPQHQQTVLPPFSLAFSKLPPNHLQNMGFQSSTSLPQRYQKPTIDLPPERLVLFKQFSYESRNTQIPQSGDIYRF